MKKLLFALLISSAPILLGMQEGQNTQSQPNQDAPRSESCTVCKTPGGAAVFLKHVNYAEDISLSARQGLCAAHQAVLNRVPCRPSSSDK